VARVLPVFLASRRKIREVEVEVLSLGGTDVLAPPAPRYPDPWAEERGRSNGHSPTPATALPWSQLFEAAEAEPPEDPTSIVEEPEPEALGIPLPVDTVEAPELPATVQHEEAPDLIQALEPAFAAGEDAAPESELDARTELICEIVFWRGYRKAAFYARIFDEADEPLAVAESSFFRYSGNGIPDATAEAESAYDELVERLEQDGWESVDQGTTWYGDVFRRELTVAVAPEPE
jgi:hypothetical protein